MGAFVSKRPVRLTVDGRPDEYIAILPKLGVEAKSELTDNLMSVSGAGTDEQELKLHAGRYNLAMLRAGVVGWKLRWDEESGLPQDPNEPGFVLFKPEFLSYMDEEDELVDKALEELVTRNPSLGRGQKPKPSA